MITRQRVEGLAISALGGLIGGWSMGLAKHLYFWIINHVRIVIR